MEAVAMGYVSWKGRPDHRERRGDASWLSARSGKSVASGVKPISELSGVVAMQKATEGIVITSRRYTRDARRFVGQCSLQLIGSDELEQLI